MNDDFQMKCSLFSQLMQVPPLLYLLGMSILLACNDPKAPPLPYLGFHDVVDGDTLYHRIPAFSLLDQDSTSICNEELSDYIYIADFFYTYCPTICPKVKTQMLRVYDQFETEKRLKFVSFALDPIRDNVERLHQFSENIGVDSERWHFLTGEREVIWNLAEQYLISVRADEEEPGGIYHSGKILLIDPKGHIRAFADGTEAQAVDAFMESIEQLLQTVK
ncbi:MAG: SCO family protein [Bacteroidota bacterium]